MRLAPLLGGGTGRGVRRLLDVTGVLICVFHLELAAEFRDGQGKGASRRLRHAGRVPAILYGGTKEPRAITLDHQKLMTLVDNEKFYSSIINLKVGDSDAGCDRQGSADASGAQRHSCTSTCSASSRRRRSASTSRSTSRVRRRRLA